MVWLIIGLIGWVLLLSPLFPAGDCHCRLRCQCGKKRKKAERRAADIERQERERAVTEQARIQTAAEAQRQRIEQGFREQAETFGREAGFPEAARRAGLAPEALVREAGPITTSLLDIINQRLAAPPTIPFEDVTERIAPLLGQIIGQRFAGRGFPAPSGLELEAGQRASVELAIQQAAARERNRLLNEQFRQQTLAEAAGVSEAATGLSERARTEQQALATTLANLRQTGALTGAQLGLTGLTTGAEAFQRGQERAFGAAGAGLNLLSQREQAAAARDAAIARSIGQIAAAPLYAIPGVEPILGPIASSGFGQIGEALGGGASFGGGGGRFGTPPGAMSLRGPSSIESLLAAQRTAPFRGAGISQHPELETIFQRFPQRKRFRFFGPFQSEAAF